MNRRSDKGMDYKKLVQQLNFTPKENSSSVYCKKYSQYSDYLIEIDFIYSCYAPLASFIFPSSIHAALEAAQ
jgi:hypothetical protein